MLRRKRQDLDSRLLRIIILIICIVRTVIVKYYYFFSNGFAEKDNSYQIFLSFCFPFFLSLRIDVRPHPRVAHCAGRVQNYFGFLLAQTSAAPRGRGKDDTSVNSARECPKFLFLLLLLLLVVIIIIFATNKQCNHNFCTQQQCLISHGLHIILLNTCMLNHGVVSSFTHLYFEIQILIILLYTI